MKSSCQRKRKSSDQHSRDTSNVIKQPAKLAVRRRPKATPDKDAPVVSSRENTSTNVTSGNRQNETAYVDQHMEQTTHSAKIMMLLFPLTPSIRLGLEENGYNPFLELTLSRKKKITSVIKHLKAKWGRSSFAIGELVIFPFDTLVDNTHSSLRWTKDSNNITAEDVHVAVGSPPVFRLSYGWISGQQLRIAQVPRLSRPLETCLSPNSNRKECTPYLEGQLEQPDRLGVLKEELRKTININKAPHPDADNQFCSDVTGCDLGNGMNVDDGPVKTLILWDDLTNLSIGGLLSEVSLQAKIKPPKSKPVLEKSQESLEAGLISETTLQCKNKNRNQFLEKETSGNGSMSTQLMSAINSGGLVSKSSEQVNMGKGTLQSEFSWDDNLTNLSIGGLLSEVSLHRKINSSLPEVRGSEVRCQETVLLNSFNTVVLESSPQAPTLLLPESHTSIFDAEETCNAFAFEKSAGRNASTSSVVACITNSIEARGFKSFASSRNVSTSSEVSSVSNNRDLYSTNPSRPPQAIDEKGKSMPAGDQLQKVTLQGGLHDEESILGLSGIKWNDTLGPFDLFLPTSRQPGDYDCQ